MLKHRFYVVACVIVALLTVTACDNQSVEESESVTLEPIGFAEWDEQMQSYRGDIVVVDMWAMWCTSCIKRFPKMVEMNEQYADQGVQFVSLNLDDHQNTEAVQQADAFLKEMNATFDNFHMDENLIDAFDHLGLKGIPAVAIFDASGEERYRLTGDNPNKQFTDKDIDEAIQELLEEKTVSSS